MWDRLKHTVKERNLEKSSRIILKTGNYYDLIHPIQKRKVYLLFYEED